MKRFVFLAALILIAGSCDAQKNDKKIFNKSDSKSFEPQTEIKVNKEYDDDGNLIRYDSVYSSYYSSVEGDTVFQDSIFNNFMNQFQSQYPFSSEPFFDELFFIDSLLHYDFFKDDFFQNRFEQNLYHMDEYFRRMDSLKNYYFKRHLKKQKSMGEDL